jgi:hypothetical protein
MSANLKTTTIACRCGEVRFKVLGEPIVTATCHCHSCQVAGAGFATLPGAPRVLNADHGGTEYVLYRKDRVACLQGESLLRAYRLTPSATTRRVLAGCCDSPMFLEFKGGHWLSLYRDRFGDNAPAVEMHTMTSDLPADAILTDGLPGSRTQSIRFMWRLFVAWAAMGFRASPMRPIEDSK